jgi:lysophospholipase L1-like esterase
VGGLGRARWAVLAVVAATLVALVAAYAYQWPEDRRGASTLSEWDGPDAGPEPPVALWIGDSFTAGFGALSPAEAQSCLTSELMGWSCVLDAQGGTGFVADGSTNSPTFEPLIGRFPDSVRVDPDVVVIDSGRNDGNTPPAQVERAASAYFDKVRARWPQARLVIIAPYLMLGATSPVGGDFTSFLAEQAAEHDATLVDPIADGWIPAEPVHVSPDGVHPSPEGHAYIAENLARAFRAAGIS